MIKSRSKIGIAWRGPPLVLLLCAMLLSACLDASLTVHPTSATPQGAVPPPAAARSGASGSIAAGAEPDEAGNGESENAAAGSDGSEAPAPETGEATLLAVGDIMVHSPQLPGYYDSKAKRYDFSPWFSRVAPLLSEGDWVVGNLETTLAGADLKYTGYPRFNAPEQLADALRKAGFGILSTANNHSMDRGFAGVQRTLRNVRKSGLIPFGTAESLQDAKRLVIVERGGIRMGFLAYTYGTNGIPVPADKSFAVSLIDPKRMAADIRRLREAGADVVTVSLHFGMEYQRLPNDDQRKIVRAAVGSGADIILGSHPHVVQPYDVIRVPATESPLKQARQGLVIYSLGNFISNQTENWKDVGLIFGVHLVKSKQADGSTETTWDRIDLTPTWVHIRLADNKRYYTVLPLRQTLETRSDPMLTDSDYARMEKLLAGIERHLHTFRI
ncbi:CapA family protein [Cohnella sp. CFH 77786]|uniref:CapA family protein n=1 Tax=Cohnella sp. CFH 77786 TaxID=2662265 RepID=UPI001C6094CB|nr:CapA family protein [Cohnella sp. CFH 77786]MBW5446556.1 CapA family protein [Cohnella sp. CFH 77786]